MSRKISRRSLVRAAALLYPKLATEGENMSRNKSLRVVAAAAAFVLTGTSGCATTGRVEALEERVDALESKIDAVDQKAEQAEETARDAQRAAESAAQRADDAARTSEAIFKKSVHK
jgi:outer membrane murein-binding lipoprotein Lpp